MLFAKTLFRASVSMPMMYMVCSFLFPKCLLLCGFRLLWASCNELQQLHLSFPGRRRGPLTSTAQRYGLGILSRNLIIKHIPSLSHLPESLSLPAVQRLENCSFICLSTFLIVSSGRRKPIHFTPFGHKLNMQSTVS